ncbi:MAG TPA: sigma-70 family RNA polymerase sigma factor [Dongiaceae bacterium]|nr:sigma-70 family RNA polymerase sigma factor [Dongiaceae bacterium]
MGDARFPTTHLSAVAGARSGEPETRRRAFESIVGAYWRPVYAHVRIKWRRAAADAEDLTQAFFARALEKEYFAGFDPARGRFRTYLRTCLDRFVANEEKAAARLKRGGDAAPLPLDFAAAEAAVASAGHASPEEVFDAEWVQALFARAVARLETHCAAAGRATDFHLFRRYDLEDAGRGALTYETLAAEIGLTASLVTNHLARVRREFRRLLLETLREITGSDEEYRLEARLLLGREPAAEDGDDGGG